MNWMIRGNAYLYDLYRIDFNGNNDQWLFSSYSYGNFINVANDRVFLIDYYYDQDAGDWLALTISMNLDGTDPVYLSR